MLGAATALPIDFFRECINSRTLRCKGAKVAPRSDNAGLGRAESPKVASHEVGLPFLAATASSGAGRVTGGMSQPYGVCSATSVLVFGGARWDGPKSCRVCVA